MQTTLDHLTWEEQSAQMLQELNLPVHRLGYHNLCIGIPGFRENPTQSLSNELYPRIAAQTGCTGSPAVEHSIREAIRAAYGNRDPQVWERCFPGCRGVPSNKLFIATLAERLK